MFHFKNLFYTICFSFLLFAEDYSSSIVKAVRFDDIYYFSAKEFSQKFNLKLIHYEDKSKLELFFKQQRVMFSISSSYVKIDDYLYHMTQDVLYSDGEFYIPLYPYLLMNNEYNLFNISYNHDNQSLFIPQISTIISYIISSDSNNYIIDLVTSDLFDKEDVICQIIDNGLQVKIKEGVIDRAIIDNKFIPSPFTGITLSDNKTLIFDSGLSINNVTLDINNNKITIKGQFLSPINNIYSDNVKDKKKWGIKTIIIDPGHGGKDPGAVGYHNIKEKNIVLDISKELGKLINLNFPEINVIYTRDGDSFLGLRNRTDMANKKIGDIFISIHANASNARSARGYEIFILGNDSTQEAIDFAIRENASIKYEDNSEIYVRSQSQKIEASLLQESNHELSEELAKFVQKALKKELPRTRNRGIKQAGFHVLIGASMPNILIETGFLSNKTEAMLLNKSSYRTQIAKALFNGIKDYVSYYESTYLIPDE